MGNLALLGAGSNGGSLAPTTLLDDTFTDAGGTNLTAHTMDVGSGWSVTGTGAYTIASDRATVGSTSGRSVALADAGHADVTQTCVVNLSGSDWGIVGRATDNNVLWLTYVFSAGYQLYERSAGQAVTLRAQAFFSVDNNDHTVQVVFSGSTIACTFDSANPMDYGSATTNQTTTNFGLWAQSNGCQWDNFKVTT